MTTPDLFPWIPQGPLELGRFADFSPVKVLDWYDGPRLFTIIENEVSYLAYLCSESGRSQRYLVMPSDDERLNALTNGSITLLQALKTPVLWVVDIEQDGAKTVRRVPWSNVPKAVVPKPSVLLSRSLEPLLRLYVQGTALFPRAVTASLVRKYVDSSYLLLHRFFQKVEWSGGFDPPVQQLAIGSLTLSYGIPGEVPERSVAKKLSEEFRKKIGDAGDPEMVDAIVKMCPFASSGPVDSVTLTGQLLPASPVTLERGGRKTWRNRHDALLSNSSSNSIAEEGNVEEIDGGRGTFTLRAIASGKSDIRCRADDAIIDELRDLFADGFPRIKIFGTISAGDTLVRVDRFEVAVPPDRLS